MEHTKEHQELICLLVEEDLAGEEKLQAQRNLLTCEACLAEYNSYCKFWRFLASPELAERRQIILKKTRPERYRLYQQIQNQIQTSSLPEPEARWPLASLQAWLQFKMWRNLRWAMIAASLVIAAIAAYQVLSLRKEITHKETEYRNLLAEYRQGEQKIRQDQERIAALNQQIAAMARDAAGARGKDATITALRQKVAESLKAQQKQAQTLRELGQKLDKYQKVGPGALVVALVSSARTPSGEARPILVSPEVLFIDLQVRLWPEIEYKNFHLVIRDEKKQAIAHTTQPRSEGDRLDYIISRDRLPPGEYILEIYGIDGKTEKLIGEHPFRIAVGP